jgi:hypothetical protein
MFPFKNIQKEYLLFIYPTLICLIWREWGGMDSFGFFGGTVG